MECLIHRQHFVWTRYLTYLLVWLYDYRVMGCALYVSAARGWLMRYAQWPDVIICCGGVSYLAELLAGREDGLVESLKFPVIDDVICRFLMCQDDDDAVLKFSMRFQLLQPKRTKEVYKLRASSEQPQQECGFVFRKRHSVQVFEE
ncbi:hypothetical protein Tco_0286338 [Tanacetum coccineum]